MIPLATTTIRIERLSVIEGATYGQAGRTYNADGLLYSASDIDRDAWDELPPPAVVASGIRAHIGRPSGTEDRAGSAQESVTWHLDCDPVDLRHTDTIIDELTGDRYAVQWAKQRQGLGLDRVEADLLQVQGIVS